jgi:hypothetical protein
MRAGPEGRLRPMLRGSASASATTNVTPFVPHGETASLRTQLIAPFLPVAPSRCQPSHEWEEGYEKTATNEIRGRPCSGGMPRIMVVFNECL